MFYTLTASLSWENIGMAERKRKKKKMVFY